MRRAARVDANQEQIVSALRDAGASVTLIKWPVDAIVGHAGVTMLVEIKDPKSAYGKKGLNKNQRDFQASWKGGPLALVDSVESGMRLLKMMESHTLKSGI